MTIVIAVLAVAGAILIILFVVCLMVYINSRKSNNVKVAEI